MKLLGNKIGLEVVETPSKVGKLYIPDEARRLTQEGIVRLIGDEVDFEIAEGDRVLYDPYQKARRIPFEGIEILIYPVERLLGKICNGEKLEV